MKSFSLGYFKKGKLYFRNVPKFDEAHGNQPNLNFTI